MAKSSFPRPRVLVFLAGTNSPSEPFVPKFLRLILNTTNRAFYEPGLLHKDNVIEAQRQAVEGRGPTTCINSQSAP
eukprot:2104935-Amphidinium_carterae.1